MKKFNILYTEGLWGHIIVGFDDGTCKILSTEDMNHSQSLSINLDETIEVRRTNMRPPIFGGTSYETNGLSRAPKPSAKEFRAFKVDRLTYDIKFLADYIAEDRCWFVVGEKPDTSISHESILGERDAI